MSLGVDRVYCMDCLDGLAMTAARHCVGFAASCSSRRRFMASLYVSPFLQKSVRRL